METAAHCDPVTEIDVPLTSGADAASASPLGVGTSGPDRFTPGQRRGWEPDLVSPDVGGVGGYELLRGRVVIRGLDPRRRRPRRRGRRPTRLHRPTPDSSSLQYSSSTANCGRGSRGAHQPSPQATNVTESLCSDRRQPPGIWSRYRGVKTEDSRPSGSAMTSQPTYPGRCRTDLPKRPETVDLARAVHHSAGQPVWLRGAHRESLPTYCPEDRQLPDRPRADNGGVIVVVPALRPACPPRRPPAGGRLSR